MKQENSEDLEDTLDLSEQLAPIQGLETTKELEEAMCRMMEVSYISQYNRTPEDNNQDLYPLGWHANQNYNEKIKILAEAVDNKKTIIETEAYQSMIEGNRK